LSPSSIKQGVRAEGMVSVGNDPAEEILRRAREENFNLIAMATHDRNLLGQAIRGSVANEVVRSASVPVLAVTPEDIEIVLKCTETVRLPLTAS
jgi:nucleotide-binding universal stress UspA family protein